MRRGALGEIAALFLRLGFTAFGGPAAHVALMEEEVVRRRRWLTAEAFLDRVGVTSLIPGPNSTELAMLVGYERAGVRGLVIAGLCFIVPAAAITLGFAWAYVAYGGLPEVAGVLYGLKPVVIAIVVAALWSLAQTVARTPTAAALVLGAAIANLWLGEELGVLVVTGLVSAALARRAPWHAGVAAAAATAPVATTGATAFGLLPLFLFFLEVGAVLFGSGYVLVAFLRGELVVERGWLGEAELLDAVAIGQVTPGPVFTTATFIGYLLGGTAGAAVATVGIFLPAFVFVAVSGPLVARIRGSSTAAAFLDGVNAAAVALMGVVVARLALVAIVDLPTALLAIGGAFVLVVTGVSSIWLLAAGALFGLASSLAFGLH